MNKDQYLAHPDVRRRMREFLGAPNEQHKATAHRICTCDVPSRMLETGCPPDQLDTCLGEAPDLARSLSDTQNLLLHLDIEYVNFDDPTFPFRDPHAVFARQQPLVEATLGILHELGIYPLHVLSGRGHHFVWQVRKDGKSFEQLVKMSLPGERLDAHYETVLPPRGPISREEGRAFGSLGRVMEYVVHRIYARSVPHLDVPVMVTDVRVGPGVRGQREIISLDTSEYGDPLDSRKIRVPYSLYRKPYLRYGLEESLEFPPTVFLPCEQLGIHESIAVMHDLDAACEHAGTHRAIIPTQEAATINLIRSYQHSSLADVHAAYYSVDPEPPERWQETYDQLDPDSLPPCTANLLRQPNDRLLQPTGMRHLLANLLARGWHPRHVAGLLRSKFERGDWGDIWTGYHPGFRADFYIRSFYGMWHNRLDEQIDFNCRSAQERWLCPGVGGCSLKNDFEALSLRRTQ